MKILSVNGKVIAKSDTLSLVELVEQNKHKLHCADLRKANLSGVNLNGANLDGADLSGADLSGAVLIGVNLYESDLRRANLTRADLRGAYLRGADLSGADLTGANLIGANLIKTNLRGTNLSEADLRHANLRDANLTNTVGLIKPMKVKPGDIYWKRFGDMLINGEYQFKVGINELRPGEVFASDERVMCSYPGFHFASREWCTKYFHKRPYEAKIRIPVDAKVNEPWATDGKASADKIEILQVFEVKTGKNVTKQFRKLS
jgi:hypothetical protein